MKIVKKYNIMKQPKETPLALAEISTKVFTQKQVTQHYHKFKLQSCLTRLYLSIYLQEMNRIKRSTNNQVNGINEDDTVKATTDSFHRNIQPWLFPS